MRECVLYTNNNRQWTAQREELTVNTQWWWTKRQTEVMMSVSDWWVMGKQRQRNTRDEWKQTRSQWPKLNRTYYIQSVIMKWHIHYCQLQLIVEKNNSIHFWTFGPNIGWINNDRHLHFGLNYSFSNYSETDQLILTLGEMTHKCVCCILFYCMKNNHIFN